MPDLSDCMIPFPVEGRGHETRDTAARGLCALHDRKTPLTNMRFAFAVWEIARRGRRGPCLCACVITVLGAVH